MQRKEGVKPLATGALLKGHISNGNLSPAAVAIGEEQYPGWFCIRSQRRSEHIAAANLQKTCGIEVVNPRIRFRRNTSRGPAWVTESMFPTYLFARFDWKRSLDAVRHTFGVAGVVHFGNFWPSVPDHVIGDLQELIGDEGVRLIEPSISTGDEVEVATGAFGGFRGIVARVMPARDRVAVLLEFLGRQSTVELPICGVEKIGSEPALALA